LVQAHQEANLVVDVFVALCQVCDEQPAAVDHLQNLIGTFTRWIESNRIDRLSPAATTRGLGYHYHLGRTQAVDAASLVDVFEGVLTARSREVFVSMQFGTPAGEEPVYKAIKEAIDAVNAKHGLLADLALSPVRIDHVNKGHSYTIFIREAVSHTTSAQLTPPSGTWHSHLISKHCLDHNKKSL